jgi:hypothetical protein
MSANKPSSGKPAPGGPPAEPPGKGKAKLRAKGKWKDVDVKDRVKKAGFDWVMYVDDDDGMETWQVT